MRFAYATAAAALVAVALASGIGPGRAVVAALSSDVTQRLSANGLRPDDAQSDAKLQALAQSNGRAPVAGPPPKIFLTKPSGSKVVVFDQPFKVLVLPSARPGAPSPTPAPTPTAPVITKLTVDAYDYNYANGNPLPMLIVDGENLGQGGNPDRRPKLDTSHCGTGLVSLYTASYLNEPWYSVDFTVPKDEPASLTMTYHGTSKPVSLTIPAYSGIATMNVTAPVGDSAPFFIGDGLGEKTASYATSSNSHKSTNVNGSSSSGTDTLGLGTSLLNGWVATATVTNIHSYRDSSSEAGTSDQFRSAKITEQPALGRLETKVGWSFQAGESISYDVVWSLSKGAFGARPVSTMSKQTSCSDEQ